MRLFFAARFLYLVSPVHRSIIHFDLDAFFVSVERKKNPHLAGVPLIVGGSNRRGVVAACSYEARKFGVHSAMPMYQAMQLCPQATVVRGDMEAYSHHSHLVTEIIADAAPLFEKASIDEFYLDVSGMDRYFGAFKWAVELRKRIIRESGLPISMALSVNKLVSKVATGEFKPNAEVEIPSGTEAEFFAPLLIEKLPMVGKHTTQQLHELGVRTVANLCEITLPELTRVFGRNGQSLWNKARALDDSPVVPHHDQKSISTESTFESDSSDGKAIKSMLIAMVEKVGFQLREQQTLASCVAVKIRYDDFETHTRQHHIPYTAADQTFLNVAQELFDQLRDQKRRMRLVGVRLSNLVHGNHQISLFDDTAEDIHLYGAMDFIKHKHGTDKLVRATTLDVNPRLREEVNLFNGKVMRKKKGRGPASPGEAL
jgi:DNA polymerase-4